METLYRLAEACRAVVVHAVVREGGAEFLQGVAPAKEVVVAANHEGGAVHGGGLIIAPEPEGTQRGQAAAVQLAAALDAPGVLAGGGVAFAAMLQIVGTALQEPVVAACLLELGHQLICHFEHVFHIALGIFLHVIRHGADTPVGALVLLAEHHAVVMLHQGSQSKLLEPQQPRRNLGVQNHARQHPVGILQQAHVVIRTVHPHVGLLQPQGEKFHVLDSQRVDDDHALRICILNKAEFFAVAVQAVGLQIEHCAPLRLGSSAQFPLVQCFRIRNHERAACYHIDRRNASR